MDRIFNQYSLDEICKAGRVIIYEDGKVKKVLCMDE